MDITPPPYDGPRDLDKMEKAEQKEDALAPMASHLSTASSMHGVDILSLQDLDPAMNMKMHLVNNVSTVMH